MGSKSKIIHKISRLFPPADNFYDLFGGGFSVTHFMIEHRKKDFKEFHFNELRSGMTEFIQDCISGKYNYDKKPAWVSREEFMRMKDVSIYHKIIWSFGNGGKSYIFGKHIENEKRSIHQAIVFNEFDQWFIDTFKIDKWPSDLDCHGKRLYLKRIIKSLGMQDRKELQQLQQLERLERLERLDRKINFYNLEYQNVPIKTNSVIYCDIPYKGTEDYGSSFNHDKFFDWADSQENPLFISEYKVDDNRFHLLKEFTHRSILAAGKNSEVTERLYGNKVAYEIIKKHLK